MLRRLLIVTAIVSVLVAGIAGVAGAVHAGPSAAT